MSTRRVVFFDAAAPTPDSGGSGGGHAEAAAAAAATDGLLASGLPAVEASQDDPLVLHAALADLRQMLERERTLGRWVLVLKVLAGSWWIVGRSVFLHVHLNHVCVCVHTQAADGAAAAGLHRAGGAWDRAAARRTSGRQGRGARGAGQGEGGARGYGGA